MIELENKKKSLSYMEFLCNLYRCLEAAGVARSSSPVIAGIENRGKGADEEFDPPGPSIEVGRVIDFIEEHAVESISLDILAGEAHLSKYHLIQKFRCETGLTPWSYVQKYRIQQAKELLQKGESPTEVALKTGFFDQSHLTRVFKKEEGITPGAFQDDLSEGDDENHNIIQ